MKTFFFFFGLQLILGRKTNLVWAGKFSFWSLLFSNFLNFLGPPFRKSCVRYWLHALQIFDDVPESNHVFALLISMPTEFSLMHLWKALIFIKISLKLRYLKKIKFFGWLGLLVLNMCCSYFKVLESYYEKQGFRYLLSIGGIICNFTPILPYF